MLRLATATLAVLIACAGALAADRDEGVILPSGWRLTPPQPAALSLGTMPQGIALSPDGSMLAVTESGVGPPALRLVELSSLRQREVAVRGIFGRPVWIDRDHVLAAGANADALVEINVRSGAVRMIPSGKGSWPAAVAALPGGVTAGANDGEGTIAIGSVSISVGGHPSDLVFSPDAKTLYVSVRTPSSVSVVDTASRSIKATIPTGLHPSALALSADGSKLYVAESDDDSVGVIDTRTRALVKHVDVGLHAAHAGGSGASPNALALHGSDLFVSLGAENAVGIVRGDRLVERIAAGWYPTGIAVGPDGTLFVVNGKGEGALPNPQFDPLQAHSPGYVGESTIGSLRVIRPSEYADAATQTRDVIADASATWTPPPGAQTVLRAGGPIRHVIYVIKENRSYDQVLGDLPGANGDAGLAMFGFAVTPNQHALAKRFGIFDNAFTDAQVSADGHNWTDAAFANDYVERFWPPNYGGRRELYDFLTGSGPNTPHGGYLWDAARRAGLSYRDYGEAIDYNRQLKIGLNSFAGLAGHFDPRYAGWDLRTSDAARFAEWSREFDAFVKTRTLPQFEIVYLPNDHTAGTRPGMPTPRAYIALNDWMAGKLVERVSHSRYWQSSAIFVLEDDAQNGPDHVSDQRSTFYIASPYARGGVQHAHYSTASFVHTIELLLGLPPLSIYDATAQPLYDAFAATPVNAAAFQAVRPHVDLNELNARTAYGAALSAKMDFSHPDAADPRVLNEILAHAAKR